MCDHPVKMRCTSDFPDNRAARTQGAALCYGRFLQADPLGYGDGMNMYNYVGSDPINSTDPSGLADCAGTESQNDNYSITVTGTRASNTGFVVNAAQTAYSIVKDIFKGLSSIFCGKKKRDQSIIADPNPIMAASPLYPKLNGSVLVGPTGFPGRVLLSNSQIRKFSI